jgi:hypothetical protein
LFGPHHLISEPALAVVNPFALLDLRALALLLSMFSLRFLASAMTCVQNIFVSEPMASKLPVDFFKVDRSTIGRQCDVNIESINIDKIDGTMNGAHPNVIVEAGMGDIFVYQCIFQWPLLSASRTLPIILFYT